MDLYKLPASCFYPCCSSGIAPAGEPNAASAYSVLRTRAYSSSLWFAWRTLGSCRADRIGCPTMGPHRLRPWQATPIQFPQLASSSTVLRLVRAFASHCRPRRSPGRSVEAPSPLTGSIFGTCQPLNQRLIGAGPSWRIRATRSGLSPVCSVVLLHVPRLSMSFK